MMAEELGTIRCGGVPMAIGVQTDMATPALARFGSDEVRREFLAPAIAGDAVACIGVSEPGAGSDVASIKTSARSDGDDYVINGGKMWITNGVQADWICLLANTSDGQVHRNKSLICVPMKARGRSEEHTSELQSPDHLVCRLLLEKKKKRPLQQASPADVTVSPRLGAQSMVVSVRARPAVLCAEDWPFSQMFGVVRPAGATSAPTA